jgi:hypothetical protein
LKKALATLAVTAGLIGAVGAVAPAARAGGGGISIQKIVVTIDPSGPPCVFANVTLFGHTVGTGFPGVCLP